MAHPMDVLVGKRLRERRLRVGMTTQQLADRVGVTNQQIEKYETGAERISASGIWDFAAAVDVPVLFFFNGIDGQPADTVEDSDGLAAARISLDQPRAALDVANTPNLPKSGRQVFSAVRAMLRAMSGEVFKTAARRN